MPMIWAASYRHNHTRSSSIHLDDIGERLLHFPPLTAPSMETSEDLGLPYCGCVTQVPQPHQPSTREDSRIGPAWRDGNMLDHHAKEYRIPSP
jgi:hypothetical protein